MNPPPRQYPLNDDDTHPAKRRLIAPANPAPCDFTTPHLYGRQERYEEFRKLKVPCIVLFITHGTIAVDAVAKHYHVYFSNNPTATFTEYNKAREDKGLNPVRMFIAHTRPLMKKGYFYETCSNLIFAKHKNNAQTFAFNSGSVREALDEYIIDREGKVEIFVNTKGTVYERLASISINIT